MSGWFSSLVGKAIAPIATPIAVQVVRRILSTYFDMGNPEVEFVDGCFELSNIPFANWFLLEEAEVPLIVIGGQVGKLKVELNVTDFIFSRPFKVTIRDVTLLTTTTSDGEMAARLTSEYIQKWKRLCVELLEHELGVFHKSLSNLASSGIAWSLLKNLEVEVTNVHLRFEDSRENCAVGVVVNRVAISREEAEKEAQSGEITPDAFKMVKLKGVSAYALAIDSYSPAPPAGQYYLKQPLQRLARQIPQALLCLCKAAATFPEHHILRPCDATAAIAFNTKECVNVELTPRKPHLSIECSLELQMQLNDSQYAVLAQCATDLSKAMRRYRALLTAEAKKLDTATWEDQMEYVKLLKQVFSVQKPSKALLEKSRALAMKMPVKSVAKLRSAVSERVQPQQNSSPASARTSTTSSLTASTSGLIDGAASSASTSTAQAQAPTTLQPTPSSSDSNSSWFSYSYWFTPEDATRTSRNSATHEQPSADSSLAPTTVKYQESTKQPFDVAEQEKLLRELEENLTSTVTAGDTGYTAFLLSLQISTFTLELSSATKVFPVHLRPSDAPASVHLLHLSVDDAMVSLAQMPVAKSWDTSLTVASLDASVYDPETGDMRPLLATTSTSKSAAVPSSMPTHAMANSKGAAIDQETGPRAAMPPLHQDLTQLLRVNLTINPPEMVGLDALADNEMIARIVCLLLPIKVFLRPHCVLPVVKFFTTVDTSATFNDFTQELSTAALAASDALRGAVQQSRKLDLHFDVSAPTVCYTANISDGNEQEIVANLGRFTLKTLPSGLRDAEVDEAFELNLNHVNVSVGNHLGQRQRIINDIEIHADVGSKWIGRSRQIMCKVDLSTINVNCTDRQLVYLYAMARTSFVATKMYQLGIARKADLSSSSSLEAAESASLLHEVESSPELDSLVMRMLENSPPSSPAYSSLRDTDRSLSLRSSSAEEDIFFDAEGSDSLSPVGSEAPLHAAPLLPSSLSVPLPSSTGHGPPVQTVLFCFTLVVKMPGIVMAFLKHKEGILAAQPLIHVHLHSVQLDANYTADLAQLELHACGLQVSTASYGTTPSPPRATEPADPPFSDSTAAASMTADITNDEVQWIPCLFTAPRLEDMTIGSFISSDRVKEIVAGRVGDFGEVKFAFENQKATCSVNLGQIIAVVDSAAIVSLIKFATPMVEDMLLHINAAHAYIEDQFVLVKQQRAQINPFMNSEDIARLPSAVDATLTAAEMVNSVQAEIGFKVAGTKLLIARQQTVFAEMEWDGFTLQGSTGSSTHLELGISAPLFRVLTPKGPFPLVICKGTAGSTFFKADVVLQPDMDGPPIVVTCKTTGSVEIVVLLAPLEGIAILIADIVDASRETFGKMLDVVVPSTNIAELEPFLPPQPSVASDMDGALATEVPLRASRKMSKAENARVHFELEFETPTIIIPWDQDDVQGRAFRLALGTLFVSSAYFVVANGNVATKAHLMQCTTLQLQRLCLEEQTLTAPVLEVANFTLSLALPWCTFNPSLLEPGHFAFALATDLSSAHFTERAPEFMFEQLYRTEQSVTGRVFVDCCLHTCEVTLDKYGGAMLTKAMILASDQFEHHILSAFTKDKRETKPSSSPSLFDPQGSSEGVESTSHKLTLSQTQSGFVAPYMPSLPLVSLSFVWSELQLKIQRHGAVFSSLNAGSSSGDALGEPRLASVSSEQAEFAARQQSKGAQASVSETPCYALLLLRKFSIQINTQSTETLRSAIDFKAAIGQLDMDFVSIVEPYAGSSPSAVASVSESVSSMNLHGEMHDDHDDDAVQTRQILHCSAVDTIALGGAAPCFIANAHVSRRSLLLYGTHDLKEDEAQRVISRPTEEQRDAAFLECKVMRQASTHPDVVCLIVLLKHMRDVPIAQERITGESLPGLLYSRPGQPTVTSVEVELGNLIFQPTCRFVALLMTMVDAAQDTIEASRKVKLGVVRPQPSTMQSMTEPLQTSSAQASQAAPDHATESGHDTEETDTDAESQLGSRTSSVGDLSTLAQAKEPDSIVFSDPMNSSMFGFMEAPVVEFEDMESGELVQAPGTINYLHLVARLTNSTISLVTDERDFNSANFQLSSHVSFEVDKDDDAVQFIASLSDAKVIWSTTQDEQSRLMLVEPTSLAAKVTWDYMSRVLIDVSCKQEVSVCASIMMLHDLVTMLNAYAMATRRILFEDPTPDDMPWTPDSIPISMTETAAKLQDLAAGSRMAQFARSLITAAVATDAASSSEANEQSLESTDDMLKKVDLTLVCALRMLNFTVLSEQPSGLRFPRFCTSVSVDQFHLQNVLRCPEGQLCTHVAMSVFDRGTSAWVPLLTASRPQNVVEVSPSLEHSLPIVLEVSRKDNMTEVCLRNQPTSTDSPAIMELTLSAQAVNLMLEFYASMRSFSFQHAPSHRLSTMHLGTCTILNKTELPLVACNTAVFAPSAVLDTVIHPGASMGITPQGLTDADFLDLVAEPEQPPAARIKYIIAIDLYEEKPGSSLPYGYTKIPVPLSQSPRMFLIYKKSDSGVPITDVRLTYTSRFVSRKNGIVEKVHPDAVAIGDPFVSGIDSRWNRSVQLSVIRGNGAPITGIFVVQLMRDHLETVPAGLQLIPKGLNGHVDQLSSFRNSFICVERQKGSWNEDARQSLTHGPPPLCFLRVVSVGELAAYKQQGWNVLVPNFSDFTRHEDEVALVGKRRTSNEEPITALAWFHEPVTKAPWKCAGKSVKCKDSQYFLHAAYCPGARIVTDVKAIEADDLPDRFTVVNPCINKRVASRKAVHLCYKDVDPTVNAFVPDGATSTMATRSASVSSIPLEASGAASLSPSDSASRDGANHTELSAEELAKVELEKDRIATSRAIERAVLDASIAAQHRFLATSNVEMTTSAIQAIALEVQGFCPVDHIRIDASETAITLDPSDSSQASEAVCVVEPRTGTHQLRTLVVRGPLAVRNDLAIGLELNIPTAHGDSSVHASLAPGEYYDAPLFAPFERPGYRPLIQFWSDKYKRHACFTSHAHAFSLSNTYVETEVLGWIMDRPHPDALGLYCVVDHTYVTSFKTKHGMHDAYQTENKTPMFNKEFLLGYVYPPAIAKEGCVNVHQMYDSKTTDKYFTLQRSQYANHPGCDTEYGETSKVVFQVAHFDARVRVRQMGALTGWSIPAPSFPIHTLSTSTRSVLELPNKLLCTVSWVNPEKMQSALCIKPLARIRNCLPCPIAVNLGAAEHNLQALEVKDMMTVSKTMQTTVAIKYNPRQDLTWSHQIQVAFPFEADGLVDSTEGALPSYEALFMAQAGAAPFPVYLQWEMDADQVPVLQVFTPYVILDQGGGNLEAKPHASTPGITLELAATVVDSFCAKIKETCAVSTSEQADSHRRTNSAASTESAMLHHRELLPVLENARCLLYSTPQSIADNLVIVRNNYESNVFTRAKEEPQGCLELKNDSTQKQICISYRWMQMVNSPVQFLVIASTVTFINKTTNPFLMQQVHRLPNGELRSLGDPRTLRTLTGVHKSFSNHPTTVAFTFSQPNIHGEPEKYSKPVSSPLDLKSGRVEDSSYFMIPNPLSPCGVTPYIFYWRLLHGFNHCLEIHDAQGDPPYQVINLTQHQFQVVTCEANLVLHRKSSVAFSLPPSDQQSTSTVFLKRGSQAKAIENINEFDFMVIEFGEKRFQISSVRFKPGTVSIVIARATRRRLIPRKAQTSLLPEPFNRLHFLVNLNGIGLSLTAQRVELFYARMNEINVDATLMNRKVRLDVSVAYIQADHQNKVMLTELPLLKIQPKPPAKHAFRASASWDDIHSFHQIGMHVRIHPVQVHVYDDVRDDYEAYIEQLNLYTLFQSDQKVPNPTAKIMLKNNGIKFAPFEVNVKSSLTVLPILSARMQQVDDLLLFSDMKINFGSRVEPVNIAQAVYAKVYRDFVSCLKTRVAGSWLGFAAIRRRIKASREQRASDARAGSFLRHVGRVLKIGAEELVARRLGLTANATTTTHFRYPREITAGGHIKLYDAHNGEGVSEWRRLALVEPRLANGEYLGHCIDDLDSSARSRPGANPNAVKFTVLVTTSVIAGFYIAGDSFESKPCFVTESELVSTFKPQVDPKGVLLSFRHGRSELIKLQSSTAIADLSIALKRLIELNHTQAHKVSPTKSAFFAMSLARRQIVVYQYQKKTSAGWAEVDEPQALDDGTYIAGWVTKHGHVPIDSLEAVRASEFCKWLDDWALEKIDTSISDMNGWQYTTQRCLRFHNHSVPNSVFRRRTWVRIEVSEQ
eukprot:m.45292 g.45292  ORF g.45292 m.45292 type:complete len:4230 (+) comp10874_c0_seq3:304-12993(+)